LRQPYNTERYFWIRVFDDASLRWLPISLGRDFVSGKRGNLPEYTAKNSEKGKDAQVFLVAQEEVGIREGEDQDVSIAITAKNGPHFLPGVQVDPSIRAGLSRRAVIDLHPFSATNTRPGGNNANPWDVCLLAQDTASPTARKRICELLENEICLISFDKHERGKVLKRDALCTRRTHWMPQWASDLKAGSLEGLLRGGNLHFFDVCFGSWRQIAWETLRAVRSKQILSDPPGEKDEVMQSEDQTPQKVVLTPAKSARWRSKKAGATAADAASGADGAVAKRVRADEPEHQGVRGPNGNAAKGHESATTTNGVDENKVIKVAILGASVSAVALRERLCELVPSSGFQVEVTMFKHVFDPARSIHEQHPFCEYQTGTFLVDHANADESFLKWLDTCRTEELIDPVTDKMAFLNVETGSQGTTPEGVGKTKPASSGSDGLVVRYRPRGGFLRLVEHLAKRTTGPSMPSDQREHKTDPKRSSLKFSYDVSTQVRTLSRSTSTEGTGDSELWTLRDMKDESIGAFDFVVFTHDSNPRSVRKASLVQVLESALPATQKTIRAAARSVRASTMAVIVRFGPQFQNDVLIPLEKALGCKLLESLRYTNADPTFPLQFASLNRADEQDFGRGMNFPGSREGATVWTLCSTLAWSKTLRSSHKKPWNKDGMAESLVSAFVRSLIDLRDLAIGADRGGRAEETRSTVSSTYKWNLVKPPFHWMGACNLTRVRCSDRCKPCSFDADVNLGWCGDMFGGLGPAGAFCSGKSLAEIIARKISAAGLSPGHALGNIPDRPEDWETIGERAKVAQGGQGLKHTKTATGAIAKFSSNLHGVDDIYSFGYDPAVGTARAEEQESDGSLLDQTWPTSVKLARDPHLSLESADSLQDYRKRKDVAKIDARFLPSKRGR
jgi:hypothetical protein